MKRTFQSLLLAVLGLTSISANAVPVLAQQTTKPAQTQSGDDALAQLKKLLTEHPELAAQLRVLLEQLGKDAGGAPVKPADPAKANDLPPIPDLIIPGDKTPVTLTPTTPAPAGNNSGTTAGTARASQLPDISVIGNNIGRFLSVKGDKDRNRLQLGEVEIGLQQPIFPGIRFDAFLNAGADNGFAAGFEEAYASFSKVGTLPFGGLLGKKRVDFGKINPIHPHARNYVDQPAALAYLVDPDSLNGNGGSLNYTVPLKDLFANFELGLWNLSPASQTGTPIFGGTQLYPIGAGITGNFTTGRLWLSKSITKGEVETGVSHGFGKADIGDNVKLTSLDFTLRRYPSTFSRIMLQGEVFWNDRQDKFSGTGDHTRSGYYLFGNFKPDQYFDYGIRYDNTKLPWPLPGKENSISLIWTDHLTEVTMLRFQYKNGHRSTDILLPGARSFNEFWLQFIWGGGAHTHPLQ